MALYRKHRGGFRESMKTVQAVISITGIEKLEHASDVTVGPYMYDGRNGWDTYIVMGTTSENPYHHVLGFTDGPL